MQPNLEKGRTYLKSIPYVTSNTDGLIKRS